MKLRIPVVFVLLGVAILVTLIWNYAATQREAKKKSVQSSQAEVTNLSNLEPADFNKVLQSEYSQAGNKAAAANTLNKLVAIEVTIGKDLSPQSIISRYIYSADNDNNNNWIYSVSSANGSFIRSLTPKEDYLGNLTPINAENWKYNFVTALQLAEKAGGLEWRESNTNTITFITLTLRNSGESDTVWNVLYQGINDSKSFTFNASSGKLIP